MKSNNKATLRREAIVVVLVTFLGLSVSAFMGIACIQMLNEHSYVYIPGSYERPETYNAIYSLKAAISPSLLSYPPKWIPHYSSFIGETYKRPTNDPRRESGYQALRFVTELFPAAMVVSKDTVSWIWTVILLAALSLLGLAQLCVMWKPISSALGNSTSSVLLSCVTGLLLSICCATEVGISILHYMDLVLGGSWFIPILWAAEIFGVFLIRGRPYNGDDLVNDLKMSSSLSAFLALSWNVLLPIGLVTLAVIEYKVSFASEFYYWRGKAYFSYWARKVAALIQVGFLLLVPITAIIQIYRYMTKGPADILDRIQLLYRPVLDLSEHEAELSTRRNVEDSAAQSIDRHTTGNGTAHSLQDDAPPKYTPPPSYTTATGARLAKIIRQSVRRSVRRILGAAARPRLTISNDNEMQPQMFPPNYSTVLTDPVDAVDGQVDVTANETIEIEQIPTSVACQAQRSQSLGRKTASQKHVWKSSTMTPSRPFSTSPVLDRNANSQRRPFTAEDVVTILRSSTRQQAEGESATSSSSVYADNHNSFRSVENLIFNVEPVGQSPAVGVNDTETSNN